MLVGKLKMINTYDMNNKSDNNICLITLSRFLQMILATIGVIFQYQSQKKKIDNSVILCYSNFSQENH